MNDAATTLHLLDDPVLRDGDHRAVQKFLETGVPVDPDVRDRVRARADRAREANFARRGYANIDEFLPSSSFDE